MASSYFVVLDGADAGIYNSLNEAEAKCGSLDARTVEKYQNLPDAFNCFQSRRVSLSGSQSQSQSSETMGTKVEENIIRRTKSQCKPKAESFEPEFSNVTDEFLRSPKKIVKTSKSAVNRVSSVKKVSEVAKKVPKAEKKTLKSPKIDRKPKTRNVCIQAERMATACAKCKNGVKQSQSQKWVALIDNGSQTNVATLTKGMQTSVCADLGGCVCCISSEVSKIQLSEVSWDSLRSLTVPFLGKLTKEGECLAPRKDLPTEWYLRHDWFSLKATIASSRSKKKTNARANYPRSPLNRKRTRASTIVRKALTRNTPGGSVGMATNGFKIPKKKRRLEEEVDDHADSGMSGIGMDMDWIQCTQARLDDVTYDSRDIPHDSIGLDYEIIFSDYLSMSVTHVKIEDAYIQLNHQIQNLVRFLNMLCRRTSVTKVELKTCRSGMRADEQLALLNELKFCMKKTRCIDFAFVFDTRLHDRIIKFNNGWSVCLGRGLDYFQKSDSILDRNDMSVRKTRAFRVITYKSGKF